MVEQLLDWRAWLKAIAASLLSAIIGLVVMFLIGYLVETHVFDLLPMFSYVLTALFWLPNAGFVVASWVWSGAMGHGDWALVHGASSDFWMLAFGLNAIWWFLLLNLWHVLRARKRRRNR